MAASPGRKQSCEEVTANEIKVVEGARFKIDLFLCKELVTSIACVLLAVDISPVLTCYALFCTVSVWAEFFILMSQPHIARRTVWLSFRYITNSHSKSTKTSG